jgi:ubiquinol-cytochrome c reductase iron-sulfur subunit/rieske iron-sulfur protein
MIGVAAPRAQGDPATMPPQPGDYFVHATSGDTTPLTPESIELDARPIRAWPVDPATGTVRDGTLYNLVMLSRWDPGELGPDGQANAAEGVVCQTVICTHASCDIGEWVEDLKIVECGCHFSRFDPKRNGAVVQGPATRKLPALALAMADGKFVVKAPFDGRVGGDVEAE